MNLSLHVSGQQMEGTQRQKRFFKKWKKTVWGLLAAHISLQYSGGKNRFGAAECDEGKEDEGIRSR